MKKSAIGIGKPAQYPLLQKHPRFGIPAHGNSDVKPNEQGEFFTSRGIGVDKTPGCFICGGKKDLYNNIAGFVRTKEAGERVVSMFNGVGARLDYRDFEPDYVQVKIGACKNHFENLQKLNRLMGEQGIISPEIIKSAKEV